MKNLVKLLKTLTIFNILWYFSHFESGQKGQRGQLITPLNVRVSTPAEAMAFREIEIFGCDTICERNQDYVGCDISSSLVGSAVECRQLCQNELDCERWIYVFSSGICSLKNGESNKCAYDDILVKDEKLGYFTGVRDSSCTIPTICQKDYDYTFCDVTSKTTADAFECREFCKTNNSCERWVYKGKDNLCYLKNGESGTCTYDSGYSGYKSSEEGFVTGVKGQTCTVRSKTSVRFSIIFLLFIGQMFLIALYDTLTNE